MENTSAQFGPVSPRPGPFFVRRPFLIHSVLVVLCWLTYLFDREDVAWRLIQHFADARLLEHLVFLGAAGLIACGIWLGAWPCGNETTTEREPLRAARRRAIGEVLHAAGIATLLPVAGCIGLVCAESIRSALYYRWFTRMQNPGELARNVPVQLSISGVARYLLVHLGGVVACVAMLVFSITLSDRLADYLFAFMALVFTATRFVRIRQAACGSAPDKLTRQGVVRNGHG
jgi:hypothetical protein